MPSNTEESSRKTDFVILTILTLAALSISTGLYEAEVMPKDEYLVSALSALILLVGVSHKLNYSFIETKLILGFLIFNSFFIIYNLLSPSENIEVKTYFIHIISISSFIAVYCASKRILHTSKLVNSVDNQTLIAILSISVLTVLLLAQLWQIQHTNLDMTSRPGGFLNPNTTAAIALMLMFTTTILLKFELKHLTLASLSLAIIVIFLAQSRAAIIFLLPFLFYLFINRNKKTWETLLISFSFLILLTLFLYLTNTIELIWSTLIRFTGDQSSGERLMLIQNGWRAFLEAPIWGNGFRHMTYTYNQSTHNEILETMVNFGLSGLLLASIAFYFLYIPFSKIFCVTCILPIFMFTHNFFDAYAIQATLGLALAADRANKTPKN